MPPPKKKLDWQYKTYKEKQIRPCYFYGKMVGEGAYIAGIDEDDNLVLDNNGLPMKYKRIP